MLYYIILFYIILCCIILYYIIFYYIILYYVLFYYIILCYILLYYIILHYIILHYIILCHVMLLCYGWIYNQYTIQFLHLDTDHQWSLMGILHLETQYPKSGCSLFSAWCPLLLVSVCNHLWWILMFPEATYPCTSKMPIACLTLGSIKVTSMDRDTTRRTNRLELLGALDLASV